MLRLPQPTILPFLLRFLLSTKMGAPEGLSWAPAPASSEEPQGQKSEWLTPAKAPLGCQALLEAPHMCRFIYPHNDSLEMDCTAAPGTKMGAGSTEK